MTARPLQKAAKSMELSQFRKQAAIQALPHEIVLEPQTSSQSFYIACLTLTINNAFALSFKKNTEW